MPGDQLGSDVVVIGAGVSGASIAHQLSKHGSTVTVIDRGGPGAGASGACDQAIFLQSKRPGLHLRLAMASRRLYDTLPDELGADLEFTADGGMVVVEDERQWEFMTGFVAAQREAGIDVELVDGAEARRIQPGIAGQVVGAATSPTDAEVNPLLLNGALLAAARRAGTRLLRGTEMTGVIERGGRVRGIHTTAGDLFADVVVNAAGPFAGVVGERAGIATPIIPRRGTILITEPVPPLLSGILLCAQYVAAKHLQAGTGTAPPYGLGLSLGQTAAGNLLIGGTREFAGFSKKVPDAVVSAIARHATRIVPALGRIRMLRTMTGFRPCTGDGLPIIEETRPGWVTAAGHEGDGIALAPITGHLVHDLLRGDGPTHHFLAGVSGARSSLQPPRPEESTP